MVEELEELGFVLVGLGEEFGGEGYDFHLGCGGGFGDDFGEGWLGFGREDGEVGVPLVVVTFEFGGLLEETRDWSRRIGGVQVVVDCIQILFVEDSEKFLQKMAVKKNNSNIEALLETFKHV